MEEKKRNYTLDLIRIIALLFIICVHSLGRMGFYNEVVLGKKMFVMCVLRSLFITCVPLFLMLTGYLMNQKTLSKKYYKGIIKTVTIYIFCSVVYLLFQKIYLHQEISFIPFIQNVLAYVGTPYAWYIELYIGLFLLIPFLNIIFNNLKKKSDCQKLLITLFCLVGLPAIINIFRFDSLSWWLNPQSSRAYFKIIPSWWTNLYPLFYYFLGAYLSKYKIKLDAKLNIILLISSILLDGLFNYYRSFNGGFIWATWNNYYSGFVMCTAFLTFNLLLKIKLNFKSKLLGRVFKTLSDASLGAYLISVIFDTIYYERLCKLVLPVKARFIYAPLMVLLVFISSILVSVFLNVIYKIIQSVIIKVKTVL